MLLGVFVTALYTFRMFFIVFHGEERIDPHAKQHLHESPLVITGPLILLAIPSVIIGAIAIGPWLFGDHFGNSILVLEEHDVLGHLGEHYAGVMGFIGHGIMGLPFWLALAGVGTAYYLYLMRPELPEQIKQRFSGIYNMLANAYGADAFNEKFFAGGSRKAGRFFWQIGDVKSIDGIMVNGSAKLIGWVAGAIRHVQTGYLYHYAFAMIIGLLVLMSWVLAHT